MRQHREPSKQGAAPGRWQDDVESPGRFGVMRAGLMVLIGTGALIAGVGCGGTGGDESEGGEVEELTTAQLTFNNGFESGNLSGLKLHTAGGQVSVATAPVASGKYSGKFDLAWSPTEDHYRSEVILEKGAGDFQFGQEYWLGMSFWYADWARDKSAEIAPFQVHRRPSSWAEGCGGQVSAYSNAPFLMFSADDVMKIITFHGVVSWSAPLVRGRWHNIVFHFKITWDNTGYVEAWKDGVKLFRRDGKLHEQIDDCGGAFRAPYFNMGVYKWDWKPSLGRPATDSSRRTLYIDNVKIAHGPAAYDLVSPGGGGNGGGDVTPPSVPTGLKLSAVSSSQINLSWNPSTDLMGVTGYRIFRNGSAIATASGTTFQSTGLTADTLYSFAVAAFDSAGNQSAQSAPQSVKTLGGGSPPKTGLVAAYGFNEGSGSSTLDASGNQNHGALKNGLTYAGTLPNTVLRFDGLDDYLTVPASASLNIAGGAITLSAWVNFADTGDHQIFIGKPVSASVHTNPFFAYSLHGVYESGTALRPRFYLTLGGARKMIASSVTIAPGWHYIAGTYDGATMKIYIDGTLRGSLGATGNISSFATPLRLGTNGGFTEHFKGRMDNVRIYDRALTEAEIKAEMPTAVGL